MWIEKTMLIKKQQCYTNKKKKQCYFTLKCVIAEKERNSSHDSFLEKL